MNYKFYLLTALLTLAGFLPGCQQEKYIYESGNLVPKTVDEDPSLPSISVNGTRLHAQTYGDPDSAMIVVVHGGPGSDYRYLLNCKAFADNGYFVVFYDQRGSGLSRRHDKDSYSIQVMYDDLTAVIAHYRRSPAQKVFLLGHSWGAMLSTAYINAYPTAVNGAILAEPGGLVWQDVTDYLSRSQEFRFFGETLNDAVYMDQFITGKENEHAILDYKFGLFASADDSKDSPIGNEGVLPSWRSGAVVSDALFEIADKEKPDWTTHLDQYTTEVLFVYSERNKAYGPEHARKVSSAYPHVTLLEVKGSGHDMISFPNGWSQFYPAALTYLNNLK